MAERTTIKSLISSSLSTKAFEHLGVPLGGTLTVNTGPENEGTCSWDMDADDRDEVLSKLLGIALAHYAVETMVMPSNADRLDNILGFLKSLVNNPRLVDSWGRGDMMDMIEEFEGFVYDIESVQQNLRP